ncbi:hypothetical protein FHX74_002239 [Friedmanniella endophytica]|uniref:DinB superfamily protein n=1 Tax=Microlunatus kandeliicorticis TaxID=1759536 RepID=A0A7W3IT03_9ACTN|nr:hypothetical protein [Microlunatus kandeliicorticis]MBA8794620.1 hypothetical protein [Microlunatus kandeliicorticis]
MGDPSDDLFEAEIRGHHSMRDHLLDLLTDAELSFALPGRNPTLAGLLVELGHLQGVYSHSFATFDLDWDHVEVEPPDRSTVAAFRTWFGVQDAAMKAALERLSDADLRAERIDRGDGFVASPFVQHQIYREAVYIFYGKASVYLRALEIDAGPSWAAWIG